MRTCIFISFIIIPFMASSQKNSGDTSKFLREEFYISVTEEDLDPPPSGLTSKFKTIPEWLTRICSHEQPVEAGLEYKIGLFESPDDYTLFLIGIKIIAENVNEEISNIAFKPESLYFSLPKAYIKKFNREQLVDKLTSYLKAFTTTSTFKKSFFKKAKEIVFETNGQVIWKK